MTNEKTYTIRELSKETGFSIAALIRNAEEFGLKKFGDGRTSPYKCTEEFRQYMKDRIKNNPHGKPRSNRI